jgi:hypothetical protein
VLLSIHRGTVEITAAVEVAMSARLGPLMVSGRVRYQGSTAFACLPPVEVQAEIVASA